MFGVGLIVKEVEKEVIFGVGVYIWWTNVVTTINKSLDGIDFINHWLIAEKIGAKASKNFLAVDRCFKMPCFPVLSDLDI